MGCGQDSRRKRGQKIYYERKESGLCVVSNCKNPLDNGFVKCKFHRKQSNDTYSKWKNKKKQLNNTYGL